MTTDVEISLPKSFNAPPKRAFATPRAVVALMLREMATTYGRSPGGYIWAVLEPIAGIALLTLFFSISFHAPPLGVNFPIFYATGMVPFLMFMDISNKLAQSLNFSRPLLAYPSITFIDALLGRLVLNLLTQLLVAYIILAGIMTIYDTQLIPDFLTIGLAFLLTAFLATGVGVFNAYMFTRFFVWQRVWAVLTRPLFIVSGIFFLPDTIPEPYRDYMLINPLAHVIALVRRGFYASHDAAYVSVLFVVVLSAVLLATGLLFLKRSYRDLLTR